MTTEEISYPNVTVEEQDSLSNPKQAINLIWQVDPNFMIEADWVNSLLSEFDVNTVIDQNLEVVLDHAVVVTRGTPVKGVSVQTYLRTFKARGFKVGVIHLSDEWFVSPINFYADADFIFRNFYRPDVSKQDHVFFLPVGPKRGYHDLIAPKPLGDRQYLWSFAGELGGKISRRTMMKYAEQIPGGIAHVGSGYSDSSGLSFEGYAKLMSDTVFALSPGGNRCVETSRIYEAIEAGAIPIVEDINKLNLLKTILRELIKPKEFIKHRVWTLKYWRENCDRLFSQSYWTQVFGPDFPCPRCSSWKDLEQIMQHTDIAETAEKVQIFWRSYKVSLKNTVSSVIRDNFFPH